MAAIILLPTEKLQPHFKNNILENTQDFVIELFELEEQPAVFNHFLQHTILPLYLETCTEKGISPKRGDVVALIPEDMRYRNDGNFMYDGHAILPLYCDIDDYGSIPPCFTIAEFPFDYFRQAIVHNTIVWADLRSFSEEILTNAKYFDGKYTKGFISSFAGPHNVRYSVGIETDDHNVRTALQTLLSGTCAYHTEFEDLDDDLEREEILLFYIAD